MLSDPADAAFIFEMHRSLREIAELVEGEVRDEFLAHQLKPDVLAVRFLTLGEAANRVSRATRDNYPQIAWQKMANLRHLIAHEYRKIDHAELWNIAVNDAPAVSLLLPSLPPPSEIF